MGRYLTRPLLALICFLAAGCIEVGSQDASSTDKTVEGRGEVPGCDSNGNSSEKNPHCGETPAPPPEEKVVFESAAFGTSHACGITAEKDLYCWGDNRVGQLGDGTNTDHLKPVKVGSNYREVSAASGFNCGITMDGTLMCWGLNGDGQVGDGSNTDRWAPVEIDPGVKYKTVSAGQQSTCGVTSTGFLKCWGLNNRGQLGDGTFVSRNSPVLIDPGVTYRIVEGVFIHRCAITTDDQLKCWGWNELYNLGNGGNSDRTVPTTIDPGMKYKSVAPGISSTCGITAYDTLKCWGGNTYYDVGNGAVPGQHYNVSLPIVIDAGVRYKSIGVNGMHGVCGVTMDDSTAKCWGDYGVEGLWWDSQNYPSSPKVFDAGTKYTMIYNIRSLGMMCGFTENREVRCWGKTSSGLFANGTAETSWLPPTNL